MRLESLWGAFYKGDASKLPWATVFKVIPGLITYPMLPYSYIVKVCETERLQFNLLI